MIKRKELPKIVFVAQIPPPHLGQSIMHKFLIEANWKNVNKKHIKVNLSSASNQFGVFSFAKILNIIEVIVQLWAERIKGKIDILYYPPSGPVSRKTFYKDLSILLFTRFLAGKTVFHFHADKFNALLTKLNKLELFFAKLIYQKPDLCIVILEPQIEDVSWLKPKEVRVIPNGIEDKFVGKKIKRVQLLPLNILYVGLLVPYKGIKYAIYASKILKEKKCDFKWTFVGGWSSPEFKIEILKLIDEFKLQEYIIFAGEKIDEEKWEYFERADILSLPTYTDLMPLCIIEGMMMSLPIITTSLRTLSFIVDEKVNGLLSAPKNPEQLAFNIDILYKDFALRQKMGINARQKFIENYTIDKHLEKMQNAIYSILEKN